MAIVPPGEAQRIVIRHARGAVIDPEDIPGLTCHIRRSYELWKRGDLELSVPPWEGIEKYDRKIQTERVAQIFDTALNTHIAHETF